MPKQTMKKEIGLQPHKDKHTPTRKQYHSRSLPALYRTPKRD